MTRYELLQALEMIFPNSSDKDENDAWFVADEDEGIVKVCFIVDPDSDDDDLELSDYEKGYLTAFYYTDKTIQHDHAERDENNLWYGVQIGERMFDLCIWKDEDIVCVVYECFRNDNGEWSTDTRRQWYLKS